MLKLYKTGIAFLASIAAITLSCHSHAQVCDTIIMATPGIYTLIDGSKMDKIGPGSTICLKTGTYLQIKIEALKGSPESPVRIIPYEGEVVIENEIHFGLRFGKSNFIVLDGHLNGLPFGIKVSKTNGVGISIDDLSSDIELTGLEIGHTRLSGIMAKTDPDCSFASVRDSFMMRNIKIHHNYLHHIGFEGMYIGNTFFEGKTINCNGTDTLVYPHLLEGIEIFDNYLYYTGYDGIQVSGAHSGCKIYRNQVYYDSDVKQYGQMSGIIIGKGSGCDCFNNKIGYGSGIGIEVHGKGGYKIFNNLIVEAGRTYRPNTQGPYSKPGIFVGYNLYNPGNLPYKIYHNTIYRPKSEGIRFANINSTGNEFHNNIIIDPGIWHYHDSLGIPSSRSYINIGVAAPYSAENNYLSRSLDEIAFINPQAFNFMLQPASPAIDLALDLTAQGITFDLEGAPRPYGPASDAGAYEYYPQQAVPKPGETASGRIIQSCSYNREQNQLLIRLLPGVKSEVSLSLYDYSFRLIWEGRLLHDRLMLEEITIPLPVLSRGAYVLLLRGPGKPDTFRFIVTH